MPGAAVTNVYCSLRGLMTPKSFIRVFYELQSSCAISGPVLGPFKFAHEERETRNLWAFDGMLT